jgi:hypothetical protein
MWPMGLVLLLRIFKFDIVSMLNAQWHIQEFRRGEGRRTCEFVQLLGHL